MSFLVTAVTTPRLELSALTLADGPVLQALLWEHRDHLRPWIGVPVEAPTSAEPAWLARLVAKAASGHGTYFTMRLAATAEIVGGAAVTLRGTEAAISYWLVPAHTGAGYAREAVSALVSIVFEAASVELAVIECHPANQASAAVARGAGFVRVARSEHLERWTQTPAQLAAWDATRAVLTAVRPARIAVCDGGAALAGQLGNEAAFRVALTTSDGDVIAEVTSEIAGASAFTAVECLEHNASLTTGALCMRGAVLLLRHATSPFELAPAHIERVALEAQRLRLLATSLRPRGSELDYAL